VSVTAYHSFSGEVEASNTPTIRRLTPSCRHQLSPIALTLDPKVLAGKPVIRGTRLSVEFVIGLMAEGWSELDILGNYPGITHDDIIACLAYARDTLSSEKVFPSAA